MLIHAYRRSENTPVNLFDVDYLFAAHPENKKAFVCEVTQSEAIDRLLSITEAYVEYGKEPPKPKAQATPVMPLSASDAERELGFRLADGAPLNEAANDDDVEDTRSPEQKAFAESEALRIAQEEQDEADAIAERDAAIAADAKAKEDAAAAEALRQSELDAARAAGTQEVKPAAGNPAFVLTAGKGAKAVTTDLNAMDDAALRAWSKEQGLTRLPSKATGDDLRAAIVAKITAG